MKKQRKLLIFDMDGVILNSEPIHENGKKMILEKYGVSWEKNLDGLAGMSAIDFWKMVVERFHIDEKPEELAKEQFDFVAQQIKEKKISANKGLLEVLAWAK